MQSAFLYTRKSLGLDYRVWVVMCTLCMVLLALFGYRKISLPACVAAQVQVNGRTVTSREAVGIAGAPVHFKAIVDSSAEVLWDFGDESPLTRGASVSHIYRNKGFYWVRAIVNDRCTELIELRLLEGSGIQDNQAKPFIEGASKVQIGVVAQFWCFTPARTYEWKVLGHPEFPVSAERLVSYQFNVPQTYTIELTLDGDPARRVTRDVLVQRLEVPMPPVPDPSQFPAMGGPVAPPENPLIRPEQGGGQPPAQVPDKGNPSAAQPEGRGPEQSVPGKQATTEEPAKPTRKIPHAATFMGELQEVIDGKKEEQVLYDRYLKFKGSTMVMVNNETRTNITLFIQDMRNTRKYKLKEVKELQLDETGEIQMIYVVREKVSMLRRVISGGKN